MEGSLAIREGEPGPRAPAAPTGTGNGATQRAESSLFSFADSGLAPHSDSDDLPTIAVGAASTSGQLPRLPGPAAAGATAAGAAHAAGGGMIAGDSVHSVKPLSHVLANASSVLTFGELDGPDEAATGQPSSAGNNGPAFSGFPSIAGDPDQPATASDVPESSSTSISTAPEQEQQPPGGAAVGTAFHRVQSGSTAGCQGAFASPEPDHADGRLDAAPEASAGWQPDRQQSDLDLARLRCVVAGAASLHQLRSNPAPNHSRRMPARPAAAPPPRMGRTPAGVYGGRDSVTSLW